TNIQQQRVEQRSHRTLLSPILRPPNMRMVDDRPATQSSPLSPSSPGVSTIAPSGETDALLNSSTVLPRVSSPVNQIPVNEDLPSSSGSIDADSKLSDRPSWGTLPAISRDYTNFLCFHLHNSENCEDLANLSQVSTHYSGVNGFMKK
ncbi:hypothetical protein PMAYCL1PPCAC_27436, partial [Pristionchus mayeri]